MVDLKAFAEQLVNLTVKEVNELTKILKVEYSIEPATTTVVTNSSVGEAVDERKEEKTVFDVILKTVGANKLATVKLVKELTGLGLKESKNIVDSVPSLLKEGIAKEEAEALKRSLEEVGAEIDLK